MSYYHQNVIRNGTGQGMKFRERSLMQIAELICGNRSHDEVCFFRYRSSKYLTEFFRDCDTDFIHDGSSRAYWVADVLKSILSEPQASANTPPETFSRAIRELMDQGDAENEGPSRLGALAALNAALTREGFEAFYGEDKQCYLRHLATATVAIASPNPHRPFSALEVKKREQLIAYLDQASEDDLIGEILLPLFRQLGFHRITSAGHADKALEYGKDIWMKFTLPTTHVLYFGIQVKKGKLIRPALAKGQTATLVRFTTRLP
ncbi:hypothetical protein ACVWXL_008994 [Bradyrhizobium sp. GM22.5]